jgi:hypothetical protein
MIQDFSEDVKEFLLSYSKIHQLRVLAENEMDTLNASLEGQIAKQSWYSIAFRTDRSPSIVQVWKEKWHPSKTQGCPWIHFEYNFSWSDCCVLGSLDVESGRIASQDAVQKISSVICDLLSIKNPPNLFRGQGWILKPQLEGHRMLLLNREDVKRENFSAEWLFKTGTRLFNELSEMIPYVDEAIQKIFP